MPDPVGLGPYSDKVHDQLYSDDDGNVDNVVSRETPTPPTTNVKGFIAYRGSEQHGVRFSPESEGATRANMYAAEQQAFESYTNPEVAVRDIVPVRPLAVEVVNNPNLLNVRRARIRTVLITANTLAPVLLLPQDWNRTRLIISVTAVANSTLYLKTGGDNSPTMDAWPVPVAAGTTVTVLESLSTSAFYAAAGAADISVILYTEYPVYDGERIIDNAFMGAGGNG